MYQALYLPLSSQRNKEEKKKKKSAWSQVRIALALGLPLPSAGMRGKENMLTIFFQNIILVLEYQLIECLCSEEKFWVEIGQKKFVWNGVGDSRDMAAHPQPMSLKYPNKIIRNMDIEIRNSSFSKDTNP